MKKSVFFITMVMLLGGLLPLGAISYDNNEFQRQSRMYSAMAATAYDEGDYDTAVEYATEAQKNAELSEAFIRKMLARAEAEEALQRARTRLAWAEELKAERNFPTAFASAQSSVASGSSAFDAEQFADATRYALAAIQALEGIREIIPLPAYYRVDRWQLTRDCFWNVAALPAIYGDPFKWQELYQNNLDLLRQRTNPHLIMPGMIMRIPSLKGEYREGIYDPKNKYESFKDVTSAR